DWVYLGIEPLPPGGVDLRILDTESGTYATTSIAVVVAEDRTSEPLVVATTEGEVSEILQGLEWPDVAPAPVEADGARPPAAPAASPSEAAQVAADPEAPEPGPAVEPEENEAAALAEA